MKLASVVLVCVPLWSALACAAKVKVFMVKENLYEIKRKLEEKNCKNSCRSDDIDMYAAI